MKRCTSPFFLLFISVLFLYSHSDQALLLKLSLRKRTSNPRSLLSVPPVLPVRLVFLLTLPGEPAVSVAVALVVVVGDALLVHAARSEGEEVSTSKGEKDRRTQRTE